MSEALKDLTVSNDPQAEITRLARSEGRLTLSEDGLAKVNQGITSNQEVARVAV